MDGVVFTIALVEVVEIKVLVSAPGVVDVSPGRDFGEERSGISGERVQSEAVE